MTTSCAAYRSARGTTASTSTPSIAAPSTIRIGDSAWYETDGAWIGVARPSAARRSLDSSDCSAVLRCRVGLVHVVQRRLHGGVDDVEDRLRVDAQEDDQREQRRDRRRSRGRSGHGTSRPVSLTGPWNVRWYRYST